MDFRLLGLASGVLIAGCCGMCAETISSENVRTEGLYEQVNVETNGDGTTRIAVTLRVGGALSNLYPAIGIADRLEARVGGKLAELVFDKGIVSLPSYRGEVQGDPGGKAFEILFTRSGNTSATGTRVTMPPSFTISSPAEDTTLSLSHPALSLAWGPPSAEPMSWRIEGDCIVSDSGSSSPDTGRAELTLRPAPTDAGAPAGGCKAKIFLERTGRGVIDPAFGQGGAIQATQRRERVVQITP